jgi:hypothetical protein
LSTTQTNVSYSFNIEVDANPTNLLTGFVLYTGATSNDALAISLANAIKAVSWPTGATVSVQLDKNSDTGTFYTATGDPLAFS